MIMTTDIGISLKRNDSSVKMCKLTDKQFIALYHRAITEATDRLMLFVRTYDLLPKMKRLCAVDLGFGCSNCVHVIKEGEKDIRDAVYYWLAHALNVSSYNYALFSDVKPRDYWAKVSVCDTYLENLRFSVKQSYVEDETEYALTICELKNRYCAPEKSCGEA